MTDAIYFLFGFIYGFVIYLLIDEGIKRYKIHLFVRSREKNDKRFQKEQAERYERKIEGHWLLDACKDREQAIDILKHKLWGEYGDSATWLVGYYDSEIAAKIPETRLIVVSEEPLRIGVRGRRRDLPELVQLCQHVRDLWEEYNSTTYGEMGYDSAVNIMEFAPIVTRVESAGVICLNSKKCGSVMDYHRLDFDNQYLRCPDCGEIYPILNPPYWLEIEEDESNN